MILDLASERLQVSHASNGFRTRGELQRIALALRQLVIPR
jgi:hypothetical protein